MVKNGCGQFSLLRDCISRMKWWKELFLLAGTKSRKLKDDWKFFGWVWSKMCMASLMIGNWRYLKNEQMEWTDWVKCWHRFTKRKSWSKLHSGGHGQKWVWPVLPRESKIASIRKMNRWNKLDFFACWYRFRKAKSRLNWFWVDVVRHGQRTLHSAVPKEWFEVMKDDSGAMIFG